MKSKIHRPIMDMVYSMSPEELIREGWPVEIVNLIRSHDSQDRQVMERLANHIIQNDVRDNVVHVQIDLNALAKSHGRVEQERQERNLEDLFLRNGASNGCMLALFGMKKDDATTRRRLLGCENATHRGRPNEERNDEILFLWQKLQRIQMEERQAILEVQKRIGCPISVIWNAIKKDEAQRSGQGASTGNKETA